MPDQERTPLLSLGLMASQLGVRPQELRAEAEAGGLPCVRVGKRGLLFDPDRVFAVLAERAGDALPTNWREERSGR
jgi:hypothetical protein